MEAAVHDGFSDVHQEYLNLERGPAETASKRPLSEAAETVHDGSPEKEAAES